MEHEDLHPDAQVIRHKKRIRSDYESPGDGRLIDAVSEHFERHVGPIDKVFHEIRSDQVHVDVHIIRADDRRPYQVLFTTGMAELPMHTPEGFEEWRFAEVMIKLPADWPLALAEGEQRGSDAEVERWYWPVRLLKDLARLPHAYNTWLCAGHSMPNGDPPEPYAEGSTMHGALLIPPIMDSEGFGTIEVDEGRSVSVWQVMPMGPGEIEHKLTKGSDSLLELYDRMRVSDVVDPRRLDVTGRTPRRKRFFGLF
jgi:hypothetical protein